MDEPLHLSRTPYEALGIFLNTRFPSARIKKRPEMVDQSGKIRDNSED